MEPASKNACPPFACIRKPGGDSFCGRSPPSGEFLFHDADHAVTIYDKRKNPRLKTFGACHACCDEVIKRKKKDDEAYGK